MNKPFLVFMGPVATRSGYGDHARDLVRGLIKSDKYDVAIISTRWGACPMNALTAGVAEDDMIVSRLVMGNLDRQPDIFIQVTVPNEFQRIGKYNIGITAGIETTICDASWLEGCNKMDLIIVPSEHAKTVFMTTQYTKVDKQNQPVGSIQLTKPIEVLFEGVDLTKFIKTNELNKTIVDELGQVPEKFCYLFVGHWLQGDLGHDRKDVGMLVKTFLEAFKDKKDTPALVLKTSGATFSVMDRNDVIHKIDSIKGTVKYTSSLPNIYLIHGDLTTSEMNSLYNHPKIKALVSFTKGEGYGRPLLEFTTSGKPVIASNWSGQVDFLNPAHNIMLPGTLGKVHPSAVWKGVINAESEWFTINYNYAASVLIDMFENYKKHLDRASGNIEHTTKKFSMEQMDKKFIEILDKYCVTEAAVQMPTLKKVTADISAPAQVKLPTLKKV